MLVISSPELLKDSRTGNSLISPISKAPISKSSSSCCPCEVKYGHTHTHTHTHAHTHTHTQTLLAHVGICGQLCTRTHVYKYLRIWMDTRLCAHICMHTCKWLTTQIYHPDLGKRPTTARQRVSERERVVVNI